MSFEVRVEKPEMVDGGMAHGECWRTKERVQKADLSLHGFGT